MRRNKTFGGLLLIILIFFVFVGTYFCIQFSMNAYLQSIDISKISNDSANPILVSVPSQNFGYVTINEIDQ
jgi:hypothetical protein